MRLVPLEPCRRPNWQCASCPADQSAWLARRLANCLPSSARAVNQRGPPESARDETPLALSKPASGCRYLRRQQARPRYRRDEPAAAKGRSCCCPYVQGCCETLPPDAPCERQRVYVRTGEGCLGLLAKEGSEGPYDKQQAGKRRLMKSRIMWVRSILRQCTFHSRG